MSTTRLTGADVARGFHRDVVAGLLRREFPGLRYAAGRLGSGSDVLGLDDATSRDHDWGCRLTLLVDLADRDVLPRIDELLARELPTSYLGLPLRFATTWNPDVTHQVECATVDAFAAFRGLPDLGDMPSALDTALTATSWQAREDALCAAVETLSALQRRRGLPTPEAVVPFWDRPFRMVAPDVPAVLLAEITDPVLRRLPSGIGALEQWIDSPDVLSQPIRRRAAQAAYRNWLGDDTSGPARCG